jgi:hypothetical protein
LYILGLQKHSILPDILLNNFLFLTEYPINLVKINFSNLYKVQLECSLENVKKGPVVPVQTNLRNLRIE